MRITVTDPELQLIVEALDSHEYWQLSEEYERNNGYSQVPDGENPEIDACRALAERLSGVLAKHRPQVVAESEHGERRAIPTEGAPDHGAEVDGVD